MFFNKTLYHPIQANKGRPKKFMNVIFNLLSSPSYIYGMVNLESNRPHNTYPHNTVAALRADVYIQWQIFPRCGHLYRMLKKKKKNVISEVFVKD